MIFDSRFSIFDLGAAGRAAKPQVPEPQASVSDRGAAGRAAKRGNLGCRAGRAAALIGLCLAGAQPAPAARPPPAPAAGSASRTDRTDRTEPAERAAQAPTQIRNPQSAIRNPQRSYPFGSTHPGSLKRPPLRFNPPAPVKKVLANGLTLYLLPDRELPLLNAVAYVKTGSLYEPADKVGLADLTGTVLRTGGAAGRTGDELDRTLEFVGATVETDIGQEYGTASMSVLKKDADTGLQALADVLRRPTFAAEKVLLAKQHLIEGIRRKNDSPEAIADRLFAQAIYGEKSPWAREPTIAGVEGITRQDLVEFHARTLAPNNTYLAVAGDMSAAEMEQHVARFFGDWERKPVSSPTVDPVPQTVTPGVLVVPKETNQSNIRIGHLGIRRHAPDQFPVKVLNYILGAGGFSSRLMAEVRTRRGLAYSVWGFLGDAPDRGLFTVGAETKVETTHAAITAMRQVVDRMVQGPIPAAELSGAKEALLNTFVFRYQSRFQIASQRALLDLLGYPPDYLASYPKRVAAVTAADVRRAARAHLHPERMVILVVGPPARFEKPLSGLGAVRTVPLK